MNVLVTMVDVNRHATTMVEATPAPVELDMHKMAFMDVQVYLLLHTGALFNAVY